MKSTAVEEAGRLVIWGETWQVLRTSPWLGVGPGSYPLVVDVRLGHPHNALLAFAFDYGFIALVLLIVALWRWFSPLAIARDIRAMSVSESHWPLALAVACFGSLAHAQVSGVTVMPLAQLVLAITLGLLLASLKRPTPVFAYEKSSRVAGIAVAAALLVAVGYSLTQSCGYRGASEDCRNAPAFWYQNGYPA